MKVTKEQFIGVTYEELLAENAKLRDGYGSMSREHSQTIVELSDAYYSIDQLKAENAVLRQQLADVTESMGRVEMRCAKLREQVDYMTPLALYEASERELDRMRELGVEVDG